jgi:uncharacterized protein YjiS (DUF1127 family)
MSTQYRTPPSAFVRYELAALVGSLKEWRNRRRTQRALAELDEHQLRDIGLTRDEASPGNPTGYRALADLDEVRRRLP